MISKNEIADLIYNTVDIVPEGEDSVFLGTFSVTDVPAVFGTILDRVTSYYDTLLQILLLAPADRITLQMQRCFTWDEYKSIFKASHKNLAQPIFKTLLITNNAERQLFIRNRDEDESYEAFVAFLKTWSKAYNPRLYTLVYEIHN